jgi:hypothetical protein
MSQDKVLKQMILLKEGDRFNFNNGENPPYVWVVDSIKKDDRFPSEYVQCDVWEIEYHMEHPDIPFPRKHFFHADEQHKVKVLQSGT